MSEQALHEEFQVKTRLRALLGWALIFLGALGLIILTIDFSPKMLFINLIIVAIGIYFIRATRNVTKIVVSNRTIKFLPVGAKISFSEVERLEVPSWADRWDTPAGSVGSLRLKMKADKVCWVPGAFVQGDGFCRINTSVHDDQRLISTLRKYLAE